MKYLSMSLEYTKHLVLIMLLLVAAKTLAQDSTLVTNIAGEPQVSDLSVTDHTISIDTQTCPNTFFQIAIPEGGKLCQIFATDLPASMVFYVPQAMQNVIDFYQNNPQFQPAEQSLQRFMIRSKDNNTTIIVSADGAGTQVDVLVKQDPSL